MLLLLAEANCEQRRRFAADCYHFSLRSVEDSGAGSTVEVTSAHLWLYKTRDVIGHHFSNAVVGARNQTITVTQMGRTEDGTDGRQVSLIMEMRSDISILKVFHILALLYFQGSI